jgi:hypothetical protein
MLQDTVTVVPTVVDSVKVAADSLSAVVGSQVGSQVGSLFALALGVVVKFVVDLAKKGSATLAAAPGPVQALVAVAFAQLATWVSAKTGLVVNPDVTALETTLAGLTVAASAMGVNALGKTLTKATKK